MLNLKILILSVFQYFSFVTDGEKLVPDKEIGFNIQYDVDLCYSSII